MNGSINRRKLLKPAGVEGVGPGLAGCFNPLAAGQHVDPAKPCGRNPHEGELLLAAANRYRGHETVAAQR
jgi:hypothetical protein